MGKNIKIRVIIKKKYRCLKENFVGEIYGNRKEGRE